ncbi:MAG: histidine--tRNA ligase [Parcubacteria group bacterium CG10_big_fil_rev_8_21_14_0_10_38_31]|nr:MAG: histidine--tRNA ligase [Parcubacteria group bacterium CG10_big_fil_rev_8_21_14_0_10_38_31]
MSAKEKDKKEILQTPKGMRDILPEDYAYYSIIYDKIESIAEYYDFKPIQTPHLEKIELFTTAVGETTDIVEKEMYTLKTKGKDHLALRPEGTAPIMRSYIANGMQSRPQPVLLYYKGSFFRHENPQKGRLREFQQFGLEILGERKGVAEATIIKIFLTAIQELGGKDLIVHINSIGDKECRNAYKKELISYYRKKINHICRDCKNRIKTNPLRLLDCKEEKCQEIKKEAPKMIDYLCQHCREHFKDTLELLDAFEVPYIVDHTLVRGIDYYSRTVFEIFPAPTKEEETKNMEETKGVEILEEENKKIIIKKKESVSALAAGGRYDELGKILSKKEIPASGGAIGMERLISFLKERGVKPKAKKKPKIFFVQLGTSAKFKGFEVTERLRKAGIPISQSFAKEGLSDQLKIASKLNIPYAIILGQKEALEESLILRNMDNRSQDIVLINDIVEVIKKKIK